MVYKYAFNPTVYELGKDGRVRAFKSMDELTKAGYSAKDIQVKQGEVIRKPDDPTVYEYHPETQQYYPMNYQQYTQAGYDPSFKSVEILDDEQLSDRIAADAMIEEFSDTDISFEDWYKQFQAADLKAVKALAKEHLQREETRLNEDIATDRAKLSQEWNQVQQDFQTQIGRLSEDKEDTLEALDTQKERTVRDRLQALQSFEREKGVTLRAFYDDIGARNMSRSGIRQRNEGVLQERLSGQEQGINQSADDRLIDLQRQREGALSQFGRREQDLSTGLNRAQTTYNQNTSALSTQQTRVKEDVNRGRDEFLQSQKDTFKENRRPAYESYLRSKNRIGV